MNISEVVQKYRLVSLSELNIQPGMVFMSLALEMTTPRPDIERYSKLRDTDWKTHVGKGTP